MASITQLEYVVAVDQCRHFGRAAALCHVSQPTLSAQLQKLEDELQVTLFDRNKQPILPTEEGKPLIEQAHVVVNEYRRLLKVANPKHNELSGDFHLGVIPSVAPDVIPLLLPLFSKEFPKIKLSIEELPTEKLVQALDRDELDAALAATPLGLTRLMEEPLYYEPFYFFASKKHPFSKLKHVASRMLDPKELWLLSEEHCLREQVLEVCGTRNQSGCYPTIEVKGGSMETVIELVSHGQGYTLVPQMAAERLSKRSSESVLVPIDRPAPAREISLIYRRGHLKAGILKALKSTIEQVIPRHVSREKSKAFQTLGLEDRFQ